MYHQEDTISASDAAWALNAQALSEMDVWHSTDNTGDPATEAQTDVIMHDRTLGRTTNCTGYVDTHSVTWLKTNCRVDYYKNLPTQPIPTLLEEENAAQAHGGGVLLDLRGSWSAAQLTGLRDSFKAHGMLRNSAVMTAGDAMLLKIKRVVPDLRTAWRRHCSTAGCYTITPAEAAYLGVRAVTVWGPQYYSKAYVDQMHAAGFQVWNQVSDQPSTWNLLKSWGVDRTFTNNPTAFGSGPW